MTARLAMPLFATDKLNIVTATAVGSKAATQNFIQQLQVNIMLTIRLH